MGGLKVESRPIHCRFCIVHQQPVPYPPGTSLYIMLIPCACILVCHWLDRAPYDEMLFIVKFM